MEKEGIWESKAHLQGTRGQLSEGRKPQKYSAGKSRVGQTRHVHTARESASRPSGGESQSKRMRKLDVLPGQPHAGHINSVGRARNGAVGSVS